MPLSKKISTVFVLILVVSGFASMFFWANQIDFQVLYENLSTEDAGAIVSKLRERNIPHRLEGNGSIVLVPAEDVYDLRLSLAGDGLPSGGNVGFEIFDKTDFTTTKFVQELNYRRALQGELARTINQFSEVNASKVFIVLPKDSLFVEESKPASASIQLELRSSLAPSKLAAIIHLVANAVEGLEPENVTAVDTKGRVIFKGGTQAEASALLNNSQLDYKAKVENEIRENIQSMLEGIVGSGKAIVRVTAEIDFNKETLNEEEFDPAATAVRSQRDILESSETGSESVEAQSSVDQRRGVVPAPGASQNTTTRKDMATNYEINRVTRTILKPGGSIRRLSVAAVIDGAYKLEEPTDGTTTKEYIPRTQEELAKFEDIVKRAMGFSEDREDQVSIISMPFTESTSAISIPEEEGQTLDIVKLMRSYRGTVINILLVILVFFLIVRPSLRSLKEMGFKTSAERRELPIGSDQYVQLSEPAGMNQRDRVVEITKNNPEKTTQLIRGWLGEQ